MSLCIFCDEKGFRKGAKYKRHLYKDGMCTRCRRSQFVKKLKEINVAIQPEGDSRTSGPNEQAS